MLCQIMPPQHMFSTDGFERGRKERRRNAWSLTSPLKHPRDCFINVNSSTLVPAGAQLGQCGLSPGIISWLLFLQCLPFFILTFLFLQSALEGKLSKLRRHLLAIRQNLSFMLAPGQVSSEAAHHILPTAVYARLINHAAQCHQSVEECCSDLLTLTLLVPSAPWVSGSKNGLVQRHVKCFSEYNVVLLICNQGLFCLWLSCILSFCEFSRDRKSPSFLF